MKTNISIAVSAFVFTFVFLAACSKDGSIQQDVPPGQQQVSIYMTDDPVFFDQVLVDIRSVAILVDTCEKRDHWDWTNEDHDEHHGNGHHDDWRDSCQVWDSLAIQPGVYDLLSLRNGVDTLLGTGTVPDGKIKKIMIRLGSRNSLVKDSITYPLHFPPGFDSVIVIRLYGGEWEEYANHHKRLWMDFDLGRSILRVRDNMFYLRPVFRLFLMKTTGGIAGTVQPRDAKPVISVYNDSDTAYALPNHDGRFRVWGLEPGTYNVFVNGGNGFSDTTLTGVKVETGKTTKLNAITLHP